MKKIVLFFLCVSVLFATQVLQPKYSLQTKGLVSDMLHHDDKLYVSTAQGVMHIFDLQTQKELHSITLPQIKSFDGSMIGAKIYSLDLLNNKVLITSQGEGSYRNIWLYKDKKLQKIVDTDDGYMVVMAKFITDNKILFATLSNQVFLYDIANSTVLFENQLSYSSFSDFSLNKQRTKFAATDESGVVHIVNTTNGAIEKEYKGLNVDRIYDIDYKNGVVLGAGQDRRLSVYKAFDKFYLSFDFLLYACALSPDTSLAAVAYNTQNDVAVYDLFTKSRVYELKQNKAVVTKILFLNQKEVLVSSESQSINYYQF